MIRALSLAALTLALPVFSMGCQRQPIERKAPAAPKASVVELRGETMGTTWSAKVVVRDPKASAQVLALQGPIEELLEQVNDQMSTYRPESELSRFNQHASAEPFPASDALKAVVGRALEIARQSEGAFDVTLGPVIDVWGFDAKGRRSGPPSDEELAAARAKTGLDKLSVDEAGLKKSIPELQVNLSGIAKGWGVDKVHALITGAGHKDVLVEIGGEVRASGKNARGEPWRLGVNVPRADADPTAVLRAVPVEDRGLATSGDYRNFFEAGGKRYSHIIDPRTAKPIAHEIVSASVLAPDCTTADGLATASMVLGADAAKAMIEKLPGVEAFFVEKQGDQLRTVATAGFPAP